MKYLAMKAAMLLSALAASAGFCSTVPALSRDSLSAVTLQFSDNICSGTVVAPRVILTATHCFDNLEATNVKVNQDVVGIWHRADDGNDHTLIEVSKLFKDFAPLGGVLSQTDPVHIFGNPPGMPNAYRLGVVAAIAHEGNKVTYLFQMPAFFGDSGAGVFDAQGRVTTAITGITLSQRRGYSIQFAFAYPLAFSRDDLKTVGMR